MKTILVWTVLFVAVATVYGQQEPCVNGHQYKDDCNTCTCRPNGIYGCTRMLCNPFMPAATVVSKRSTGCDKGESYIDGCSICVCTEDNHYLCTMKDCYTIPYIQAPEPEKATVEKRSAGCDKGAFYYDGCNRCVCEGQVYACTLKGCFDGPLFPDTEQLPQPLKATISKREVGCDRGQSYYDGCNNCVCDNGHYACTDRACDEEVTDKAPVTEPTTLHPGCDKGKSYFDGCNTCNCLDGKYACTLMACNAGQQFPDTPQPSKRVQKRSDECEEGKSYFDGCNTCVCKNGVYGCTLKACYTGPLFRDTATEAVEVESTTLHPGCDKGQSYFDGCNNCVCAGETYVCTSKACISLPEASDTVVVIPPVDEEVNSSCDKGNSYYDGCNTCTCNNGVYTCTTMHCVEIPHFPDTAKPAQTVQIRSDNCENGESYFDGCNTCTCKNGAYSCTLKACYTGPLLPDTATEAVEAESTTLHPGCDKGQSYFDGCNTCVCGNGVYACTLKACFNGPLLLDTHPAPEQDKATIHNHSDGCDKGASYNDGCNTCTCSNGNYSCTEKACIPEKAEESTSDSSRKRREIEVSTGKYDMPKQNSLKFLRFDVDRCEPNASRDQDCNFCKCTKNGKGWLCTQWPCHN